MEICKFAITTGSGTTLLMLQHKMDVRQASMQTDRQTGRQQHQCVRGISSQKCKYGGFLSASGNALHVVLYSRDVRCSGAPVRERACVRAYVGMATNERHLPRVLYRSTKCGEADGRPVTHQKEWVRKIMWWCIHTDTDGWLASK